MTTLENRIHQGSRATEVIENEEFQAAFKAIEDEVITQWTSSPARDAEGREKCWQYLMLLRKVKTALISTMEGGKLAQLDLIHKQTMLERARGIFS